MINRKLFFETKKISLLFVLGILLCSCSSTYLVRPTDDSPIKNQPYPYTYATMNEILKGRNAKIVFIDSTETEAREITILNDSVSWIDRKTKEKSESSIQRINKIITKNHFLGAVEGISLSAFAGGGFGAAIGAASGSGEAGAIAVAYLSIIGVVIGGGYGMIRGLAKGHSYEYEFQTNEKSIYQKIKAGVLKKIPIEKSVTDTDVLYLENGRIIRGKIISDQKVEGYSEKIIIEDIYGRTHTFQSSEVKLIQKVD